MKTFLFLGSLVFFTTAAKAQVSFNNVTYSGTGCPQGTVSTAISPDGSSLSILFDEFRAEVPQYDGNNDNSELPRGPRARSRNTPTVSHKNCALSFSATLPPGTKADTLEINMQARGATMFDQGIEGYFASILVGYNGLARSRGNPTIVARKAFRTRMGPLDESWTESPRATVALQSGCSGSQGRDIRFDLKNHINVETTDGDVNKHGIITVDSNDLNGLLKFTLRTRPCAGGTMAP
jgi:hypothetical protein